MIWLWNLLALVLGLLLQTLKCILSCFVLFPYLLWAFLYSLLSIFTFIFGCTESWLLCILFSSRCEQRLSLVVVRRQLTSVPSCYSLGFSSCSRLNSGGSWTGSIVFGARTSLLHACGTFPTQGWRLRLLRWKGTLYRWATGETPSLYS